MSFDERAGWLLLGCLIGFVLGYIVRTLHEIKEELDEVDDAVKKLDEGGFVRHPIIMDIALLLVVVLTVWAAFSSQKASNDVQKTQNDLTRVAFCTQQYLGKTINALNERTTYTQNQATSNVELQRAQAEFFSLLLGEPPKSEEVRRNAAEDYLDSLTKFVKVSEKSRRKVVSNPYPTNQELSSCLRNAMPLDVKEN